MSTRRWLRMSWWTAVLALVVLAGAVAMAVLGRWLVAAIFLAVVVLVVASAVYARSGRASDLTRLNAVEYLDERDRAVGTQAFAIVGVLALVLSMLVFILGTALLEPDSPLFFVLWGQIIVLTIGWAVANLVALRRS